jgi:ABC-type transporter Mla subunit MlaD
LAPRKWVSGRPLRGGRVAMAEITIRISNRVLKGAGILLVGICLVWGTFYLWSSGFYQPKFRLKMYVAEAANLRKGAPVRVDGLDVGTVESENPNGKSASPERRIELVLRVEKRDQELIRSDSVATLITEGLLGDRYVGIERGFSGAPINDGGEIAAMPSKTFTTEEILNSVGKWVDCMKIEKNPIRGENGAPTESSPWVQ